MQKQVNGYNVVNYAKLREGAVVVCDKGYEFVCWMLDEQGNAFWGVYGDLVDALIAFNKRSGRPLRMGARWDHS